MPSNHTLGLPFIFLLSLLACRDSRSYYEGLITLCEYSSNLADGKTLSFRWVHAEHRCWAGYEGRPRNSETYTACGASLYSVSPLSVETHAIPQNAILPCGLNLAGAPMTATLSAPETMTLSWQGEDITLQCQTKSDTSNHDFGCSYLTPSGLSMGAIIEPGKDIFYQGSCFEGGNPHTDAHGYWTNYDLHRRYWSFSMETSLVEAAQKACAAAGGTWGLDHVNVQRLPSYSSKRCVQSFHDGLMSVEASSYSMSFECPDPIDIYAVGLGY